MGKYLAAAVQMDSQADRAANLEQAEHYLKEAAGQGAKLIVFPECMDYCGGNYADHATEILGSQAFDLFSSYAKQYGIWTHCGSIHEKRPNGLPYNTSFVAAPDGSLAATYRKIHLFDMDFTDGPSIRESSRVSPGRELTVLDAGEQGRLGLTICYDIRFGELYRLLALRGANVICMPACFSGITGKSHLECLLRTRAIENGCYLIAPDQCGRKKNMDSFGHTMIVDPWGEILGCREDGPGLVLAEIDTDYADQVRARTGTLHNRRDDLYSLTWNE